MSEVQVKLSVLIESLGTVEAPGPLTKLLNARLPAALAFRLSMLSGEIQTPAKHFNEQRGLLLKEHGKSADEGQTYKLEGEGFVKYQEALDALGREEVPVRLPQIKVADLGEREILTPADFYVLRWLFVEEEATERGAS